MVRSMYAAIAGMRSHQSKMDVIGNNIANVNTFAYKSSRFTFQESLYQTLTKGGAGNETYGGSNPSQVGYGSTVGSIDLQFGSSNYAPTGGDLDSMIDGDGFYLVGPKMKKGTVGTANPYDPDGTVSIYSDKTTYKPETGTGADVVADAPLGSLNLTRLGQFFKDGDGYIVDGQGSVLYGFVPDVDADGKLSTDPNMNVLRPIRAPLVEDPAAGTGAVAELIPMELGGISIDNNGNIVGKTKDGKGSVIMGRVGIANVPNPNGLEKTKGGYYNLAGNTGIAHVYQPGAGNVGMLATKGLEMPNVDLANEFAEMITTQRGFQANTRMITVTDEMLQELVNLKR